MPKNMDGAYIPADHTYGLRLELTGDRFLMLWRNSPVMDTTFTLREEGEKLIFELADINLRNRPSEEPYATVKECYMEDGFIYFLEYFPISGESMNKLTFTENTRYGNVDIVTEELLPELQGKWVEKSGSGFCKEIVIEGDRMTMDGFDGKITAAFAVTKGRGFWDMKNNRYDIVNKDPSRDGIGHMTCYTYEDGVIRAMIPVCDADAIRLEYVKK